MNCLGWGGGGGGGGGGGDAHTVVTTVPAQRLIWCGYSWHKFISGKTILQVGRKENQNVSPEGIFSVSWQHLLTALRRGLLGCIAPYRSTSSF